MSKTSAKLILSAVFIITILIFSHPFVAEAQSHGILFSNDLHLGSTGVEVTLLQAFLNASGFQIASAGPGSPGQESTYFGALTQLALSHFQSIHGINPAAGYFGPITRGYVNNNYDQLTSSNSGGGIVGGGYLPAGCTSTAGYSTLTGESCSGGSGTSGDGGCLSGYIYNIITGGLCSGGNNNNNNNGSNDRNGQEGQLRHIRNNSSAVENIIGEGDSNVKVLSFKGDVQDGDMTLDRLDIDFKITGSGVSHDISDYIDSVSVRLGSDELNSQDSNEGDQNGATTSFRFSNLDSLMQQDETATIYILVDAKNSVDDNNQNANIEVSIPEDGIRTITGETNNEIIYEYSFSGTNDFSYSGTANNSNLPTNNLTVNGLHSITAHVGDVTHYAWISAGGTSWHGSFTSTNNSTHATCGASNNWTVGTTPSGTINGTLGSNFSNCTITGNYVVSNSAGTATSTVTMNVLPTVTGTPPTATLTVNGVQSTNVNVGATIHYAWHSTGGTSWHGSYTSANNSSGASCGAGNNWSVGNSASGTISGGISSSFRNCTITGRYVVSNSHGTTTSTISIHVSNIGYAPNNYYVATTEQHIGFFDRLESLAATLVADVGSAWESFFLVLVGK